MTEEDATGTAIGLAIAVTVIPWGDTGTLAKAIVVRSLVIKREAILVPSRSPFVSFAQTRDSVSRNCRRCRLLASTPGDPEVPALVLETPALAQGPDAALALGIPALTSTNGNGHISIHAA